MGNKRTWDTQQINQILDMYCNQKMSINAIRQHFHTGISTIHDILIDNNVTIRGSYHGGSKKRINKNLLDNYFEVIDNEYKAYFLGFLFADGFIDHNSIKIEIHERDKEILEAFKKEIQIDASIKTRREVMISLLFTSQQMVQDLSKYGIVPNKTYTTTHLPVIPEELQRHFLRGLFDGDGWFSKRQDKYYTMGLVSYHANICQEFQDRCNALISDKNSASLTKKNKDSHSFVSQFQKQESVKQLATALYKDSNIYLTRKYNIATQLFQ